MKREHLELARNLLMYALMDDLLSERTGSEPLTDEESTLYLEACDAFSAELERLYPSKKFGKEAIAEMKNDVEAPSKWNENCDRAIAEIMAPINAQVDDSYRGMTAEQIYNMLPSDEGPGSPPEAQKAALDYMLNHRKLFTKP